ncbi:adult-specific rigid cuticular protein 15.7-like [Amblyomma americanum]
MAKTVMLLLLLVAAVTVVRAQQSADGSYQFRYEVKDPEGNSHFHEESSDASGARRGSFGIVHKDGQFVNTEYTADDNGYKPVIQSNVPGVSRGGR